MEDDVSKEVTNYITFQGYPKEKVFLYGKVSGTISVKATPHK